MINAQARTRVGFVVYMYTYVGTCVVSERAHVHTGTSSLAHTHTHKRTCTIGFSIVSSMASASLGVSGSADSGAASWSVGA